MSVDNSSTPLTDKTATPLVSVIMNCLNGEKYVREAIDSVYAQTYPSWEIIFWDNASIDSTAEIAKSYDKRLRYFRGDKTVSLGAARNKALEQARGDFIAFLDSDDIWMSEKISLQVPLFDDPEVGLVFSDAIYFNGRGKENRLYQGRRYCIGHCFRDLLSNYFLNMSTVMVRSDAFKGLEKWFDPRFSLSEEADFFLRIAYCWKMNMVCQPLAKWRVHGESLSWTQGERFTEEMRQTLKDFQQLFPDFLYQYKHEIENISIKMAFTDAKHWWQAGQRSKARSCLKGTITKKPANFILYWMTFLPAPVMIRLIERFRKKTMPQPMLAE